MRCQKDFSEVRASLQSLKAAIEEEGLDRPLHRPDSAQPSVRDLELVTWELVVGPEGLQM